MRRGELCRREERALGLPWSPELVERGRRSTQGTVHAARDALAHGLGMNLGGGTHHAAYAQGRGYCLFNDVAVAIAALRAEGALGRALVVDCDVHQGDGTAELLAGDPRSYTLSLHGGANYPFHRATSDLDVDLRTGTGDDEYLAALEDALDEAVPAAHPDLVFFLAGADPWEGDRLGRLAMTKAGLRERDALVLDTAARAACRSASYSPAATPRTSRTRSGSTSRQRARWRGAPPGRDRLAGLPSDRGRAERVRAGHAQATAPRRAPAGARQAEPVGHRLSHARRRPEHRGHLVPLGGRPRAREHGRGAQSLEYLRQNPRVSITVLDGDSWYRHITLHGTITLEPDEGLADIDRISKHYMGNAYSQRDRDRVNGWIEVESWHAWNGGRPWAP